MNHATLSTFVVLSTDVATFSIQLCASSSGFEKEKRHSLAPESPHVGHGSSRCHNRKPAALSKVIHHSSQGNWNQPQGYARKSSLR
jgi:hypothetical protein